jgi:hypothetical protein
LSQQGGRICRSTIKDTSAEVRLYPLIWSDLNAQEIADLLLNLGIVQQTQKRLFERLVLLWRRDLVIAFSVIHRAIVSKARQPRARLGRVLADFGGRNHRSACSKSSEPLPVPAPCALNYIDDDVLAFVKATARPFLPHPQHRSRPLRSRTLVARLSLPPVAPLASAVRDVLAYFPAQKHWA